MIREEKKYSGIEELKEAIENDVMISRRMINELKETL